MKYSKFAKQYAAEIIFLLLIASFFFVYFVVYKTPSRDAWYAEMLRQIINIFHKIVT